MTRRAAYDPSRFPIYLAAAVFFVALLVLGLIRYEVRSVTEEARLKAAALADSIEQAGAARPDEEVLARTFGVDGGAVCADPGAALDRAMANQQLSNGAAQVGVRPIVVSRVLVRAEGLVLSVYCPEKMAEFEEYVDGLYLRDA